MDAKLKQAILTTVDKAVVGLTTDVTNGERVDVLVELENLRHLVKNDGTFDIMGECAKHFKAEVA